jgi:ABC-type antimicrobial peptide transport system permease subunit
VEELKKPFVYIGIFFAIFAAFMLMNFISISISYKKKEIGILRAVGARGADVFKIFFNESLMIAGINWLLSAGVSFAICYFTNQYLRTQWNMVVTILHFGIIQLVMILLISVAVAFIGSFLPVFGVSRKKPIEAIRKAD